jgi:hypothetical protein
MTKLASSAKSHSLGRMYLHCQYDLATGVAMLLNLKHLTDAFEVLSQHRYEQDLRSWSAVASNLCLNTN